MSNFRQTLGDSLTGLGPREKLDPMNPRNWRQFFPIAFLLALPVGAIAETSALVEAGRSQIGVTVIYDPSYQALDYPGGDVSPERGVCADVVIRALRKSHGMDLQKLTHEDMRANFSEYPDNWGLKSTDRNIDHRRVLNLRTFLKRSGYDIPVSENLEDYRPGDIVTCTLPRNLPHIMIVSDRKNDDGVPLVIHNIGQGTREEDRLFEFKHTGHFRLPEPVDSRSSSVGEDE